MTIDLVSFGRRARVVDHENLVHRPQRSAGTAALAFVKQAIRARRRARRVLQ